MLHAHGLLAPNIFQVVILANRRLHDVHDAGAAIHDDPFAIVFAFNARFLKACLFDCIAHAHRQCLGLPIARAAGDDHSLKQAAQMLGVKHHEVLRLHIFQAIHNSFLQLGHIALSGGFRFGGCGRFGNSAGEVSGLGGH